MPDQRADYVITLGGDDAPLRALVQKFQTSFKSAASDIEATANKIQLFTGVEKNVKDASAAFFKATEAAAGFRAQIARIEGSGGTVGKELTDALKATEKQVAATSKEFNKQSAQLDKLRASLTTAGIDTKNLAAEQAKLTTQLQAQQKIDADRNAAAVLGIKLTKDQTAAIQQQYAALNTLRANGLASSKDIAAAQQALNANVKSITDGVKQGAIAANTFGTSLKAGLTSAIIPFVGITAAIAGVVSGFKDAIDAAKQFNQAIAEIGAGTNLSKDEVAKLTSQVRELATTLGLDLNDALKAAKDLLRSGVSKDNIFEVLKLSAEAAKAAVTDIGVGAKAANVLLDSFDLTVSELPQAFDAIIRSAKNGGPTLKEFADSAAQLGNAARDSGQDFNTVIGLLQVMTDKSNDAAGSAALLAKVLINIAKPETVQQLRKLGIETTNVAEILQQIGEKTEGGVNEFLQLGVASGKAGAALSALTNNLKEVPDAVKGAADALGTVAEANAKLYDSPKERAERFNAQLHETSVRIGEMVGAGSRLAVVGTDVLKFFNDLSDAGDRATRSGGLLDTSFSRWIATVTGLPVRAAAVTQSLTELNAEQEKTAQQAKRTEAAITAQKTAITAFSAQLVGDVKAIQEAQSRDIADIQTRADAQVSALDRSREALAKTSAETLAIQLQAAKDKLAVIQASEKAVTDATNAAVAARARAQRAAGVDEQKQTQETNAIRVQAVQQTLASYQQLYASLVQIAQGALERVRGFEQARVDIAQRVEDEIRGIRFDALSGLDQYVARMAEIDRLVSEGRKKAAEGDTAAAKQFFEQAIDASKSLAKVVNESGTVVITSTQAQSDRINALTKIQKASNEAFGDQADAAKAGADATIAETQKVADKITDLQGQYDALKATIAQGLNIKVETDQASVKAAFATLDELTKPREVVVTVKTVNERGQPVAAPGGGGAQPGFARGGFVRGARTTAALLNRGGEAVRQFARGGPVFRKPNWMKVPGTGSGDTVPARLQAGSFVVRKAASQHYGDGLMARLARGYGVGGAVLKGDVRSWAEKLFGSNNPFGVSLPAPSSAKPNPSGGSAPIIDKKFKSGDSFQNQDPPISFDTRPVPADLITAANVIQYAKEMLNSVGQTNPMLGVLLPTIIDGIRQVETNPGDTDALKKLLQAAETIGSNPQIFKMWESTASTTAKTTPTWFVDWLTSRGLVGGDGKPTGGEGGGGLDLTASPFMQKFFGGTPKIAAQFFGVPDFAQRFFGEAVKKAGVPQSLLTKPPDLFFPFARGGGSGDTVPAMLTPGEFVIKKTAASRYGSNLLHAINNMAVPRDFLANMMAPPMPVRRFAEGGPVASPGGSSTFKERGAGGTPFVVNIYTPEFPSEAEIIKRVTPAILEWQKRQQ